MNATDAPIEGPKALTEWLVCDYCMSDVSKVVRVSDGAVLQDWRHEWESGDGCTRLDPKPWSLVWMMQRTFWRRAHELLLSDDRRDPLVREAAKSVANDVARGLVAVWIGCRADGKRPAASRGASDTNTREREMSERPPCQARDCERVSLTQFTDGAGKWLDLCEEHGDLLAVGFPLKPAGASGGC